MGEKLNEKFKNGDKVYSSFIKFVVFSLGVLFLIIVNGSINEFSQLISRRGLNDLIFVFMAISLVGVVIILRKLKVSSKKIMIIIVAVGFIFRAIYAFTIESVPISDYSMIYEVAHQVLEGNYSELWGTGYIARFPHITVPVFYFAAIIKVFDNPLEIARGINVLSSTVNIVLIYFIVKEVFNSKRKAEWGALIAALYPPLILYTAVFCTENQAVPLFLLSIYIFILVVKGKRDFKYLFLSAIILSIGNLFRMVAPIIVVAYILYLVVSYDETIKKKIVASLLVVVGFVIPLVGTSTLLHNTGKMEYQLWKGREPAITSVLKGTNIEHGGRWNPEDAAIPEKFNFNYDEIEKECKRIIWERLSTTPKNELLDYYMNKFSGQWSIGDFSGSYWAEHGLEEDQMKFEISSNGIAFAQGFHVVLVLLTYIGLINLKFIKERKEISLFYYMFCGYGLFYLVSEAQARYAFVVCWLFIILALVGVDFVGRMLRKGEENGKV